MPHQTNASRDRRPAPASPFLPAPSGALVDGPARLGLLDAIRGFAILGIYWRNVFVFGMPYFAYAVPGVVAPQVAGDLVAQLFVAVFVEGTMRALVSMVFGASALLIMTAKAPADDPLAPFDRYFRRLLWLAALGLAHGYLLLWPHDILFLYGVLGLTLFPFRAMSPRALTTTAAALLLASTLIEGSGWRGVGDATGEVEEIEQQEGSLRDGAPVRLASLAGPSGSRGQADAEAFDGSAQDLPDEVLDAMAAEIVARLSGYLENFRLLAKETFEQQTSELLIHHTFDIGSMLFLGMALAKWGVLTGAASAGAYRRLALFGLGLGSVFGVIAHDSLIGFAPLLEFSAEWGDYFFDLRRVSLALGIIGAFGWFYRARPAALRLLGFEKRRMDKLKIHQLFGDDGQEGIPFDEADAARLIRAFEKAR